MSCTECGSEDLDMDEGYCLDCGEEFDKNNIQSTTSNKKSNNIIIAKINKVETVPKKKLLKKLTLDIGKDKDIIVITNAKNVKDHSVGIDMFSINLVVCFQLS